MAEKKAFHLCSVCRLNHNHGKGHRYSSRHQQKLSSLLANSLRRIKDVSFFLHNPARLRESEDRLNSFWCSFCDTKISELDSVFVCSNTIKHLASTSHHETLKKFWYENGADVKKRHLYCFQSEELAKWEDACRRLADVSALIGPLPGAPNNIHSECSSSKIKSFEAFSLESFTNSVLSTSAPLPFCKDGNYNHHQNGGSDDNKLSGDYSSKHCLAAPALTSFAIHTQSSSKFLADKDISLGGSLTCIRQPSLQSMVGNVHSGAPPPWLQTMNKNSGNTNRGPEGALSRAQERKLKKLRNPKRVGAAWAERRRGEMAREALGQPSRAAGPEGGSGWMPNFGRVWQTGSRKETRKEFEVEKYVQSTKPQPPQTPKAVQPYISKRQKLEATQHEQANISDM